MLVLPHLGVRDRNLLEGENLRHTGIDTSVDHKAIGGACLFEMREVRTLNPLLPHPDIARVKSQVEPCRPRAEDDHASTFDEKAGQGEGLLARMLEDDVDIFLPGDFPYRFAEGPRSLRPGLKLGLIHFRQLPPTAVKLLADDDTLGAERFHVIAL
jgi:hypothetical protein